MVGSELSVVLPMVAVVETDLEVVLVAALELAAKNWKLIVVLESVQHPMKTHEKTQAA